MRAINLFSAFVFLGCAVAAQSAASTDCFTSPALPACATFTLNDTQLQADLQSICPTMGGSVTGWPSACTLYQTCNQGLGATAPCSPLVLIRSACAEQPDLPACSKYAKHYSSLNPFTPLSTEQKTTEYT